MRQTARGTVKFSAANAEGQYLLGVHPGNYTLTAKFRGYQSGTAVSVEVANGENRTVALQVSGITEPIAGSTGL
ncbi:carboxypeptidase-like regulatory domain-containing protein [Neobacillus sp. BF23-41]|uniref:carboxypeptidase-like regulatory domain-containing protein n=1 Tax=Neobacillus sp. BF23-41 TaxID=3240280 RepID=UPI0034E3C27D